MDKVESSDEEREVAIKRDAEALARLLLDIYLERETKVFKDSEKSA